MAKISRILACLYLVLFSISYAHAFTKHLAFSHIVTIEQKKWVVIPIRDTLHSYRVFVSERELCQRERGENHQCHEDWRHTQSIDALLQDEYDYTTTTGLRIRITRDALCAIQQGHGDICTQ